MSLKVAIVEDSLENIDTLQYFLERCAVPIELIGTATTLEDATHLLHEKTIDLALLDIQLNDRDIFELLDSMNQKDAIHFDIIFVTAHSSFEYATKAIQFACLDFITKPISEKDLHHAIERAYDRKGRHSNSAQLNLLLEIIQGNIQSPKSMSINLPKGVIEIVELADIKYIEADGSTCYIHLHGERALHSVKSLGHYSHLLEMNTAFTSISRNSLVNVNHIKRYDHREKTLTLKSGESLTVSHRHSTLLKQKLSPDNLKRGLWQTLKDLFG